MRTRSWIGGSVILALSAGCGPGGTPICGAFGDACTKAQDVARYLGNEYGELAAASGGPFDPAGPALKSGRLAFAVRGATARNAMPDFEGVTVRPDGTDTTRVPVNERQATAVSVNATLRALPGWRIGSMRVGSVDLGGGLTVLAQHDATLDMQKRVGFDVGARIGLLQETSVIPAVSLTASRIQPPAVSSNVFRLTTTSGMLFATVNSIEPTVIVTRFSVAKHLGRFGLAVGTSRARYHTSAGVHVWSSDGTMDERSLSGSSQGSRRSAFLGGSYTLGDRVSIEAEIGRLYGGDASMTVARFGNRPSGDARRYVMAGTRLTLGKLYSLR